MFLLHATFQQHDQEPSCHLMKLSCNFLILNSGKTEVICFGLINLRESLFNNIVTLDGIVIASSSTLKNHGVIFFFFYQDLSFNCHMKQVSRASFFHLHNITKIRSIFFLSDAEELAHAFVTCGLDCCNNHFSWLTLNSLKIFYVKPKCCGQSPDCFCKERSHASIVGLSRLAPCKVQNRI